MPSTFNCPFAAAISEEVPENSDDSETEESKSQLTIEKTGENKSLMSEIPKPLPPLDGPENPDL
jgi:hypothetical protein